MKSLAAFVLAASGLAAMAEAAPVFPVDPSRKRKKKCSNGGGSPETRARRKKNKMARKSRIHNRRGK